MVINSGDLRRWGDWQLDSSYWEQLVVMVMIDDQQLLIVIDHDLLLMIRYFDEPIFWLLMTNWPIVVIIGD